MAEGLIEKKREKAALTIRKTISDYEEKST